MRPLRARPLRARGGRARRSPTCRSSRAAGRVRFASRDLITRGARSHVECRNVFGNDMAPPGGAKWRRSGVHEVRKRLASGRAAAVAARPRRPARRGRRRARPRARQSPAAEKRRRAPQSGHPHVARPPQRRLGLNPKTWDPCHRPSSAVSRRTNRLFLSLAARTRAWLDHLEPSPGRTVDSIGSRPDSLIDEG